MNSTYKPECDLTRYQCSNRGIVLPLVSEYTWPIPWRITLYLLGLLWSFLGVSIIADIFMQSIEVITSKTRTVKLTDPNNGEKVVNFEVKVWNDTVANLSLMALGSSAPEILLSCIEIIFNNFMAGELGPGTIVGSAAVNMLIITGVCISAIPAPEVRRIKIVKVFFVTASFSIFAYIWLVIIVIVHTRGQIELWEALVTLLLFPILIVCAYMVDKGIFCKDSAIDIAKDTVDGEDNEEIGKVIKRMLTRSDMTDNDIAKIAAKYVSARRTHSMAWYRINACRNIAGAAKLEPTLNDDQSHMLAKLETDRVLRRKLSIDESRGGTLAIIKFAASFYAVSERDGHVTITLERRGKIDNEVCCTVETVDGTAKAVEDYTPLKQKLTFNRFTKDLSFKVEIIDDNKWEPDEVFFVRLTVHEHQQAKVGPKSVCQVTILDNDDPGTIEMASPSVLYKESCGTAQVLVHRFDGVEGRVKVKWETTDLTAVEGKDYIGKRGEIIFEQGEVEKAIEIPIINDQEIETDVHFNVTLVKTSGGAEIGRAATTLVTIVEDNDLKELVKTIKGMTKQNTAGLAMYRSDWTAQFRNALTVNGGDVDGATNSDYVMHFLTLPWKLLFAFVPPTSMLGGWLTFFMSLCMIFVVTIVIGDLAKIFGCLVGLRDSVTAITLVALGTSMPDLFASKTAATREKTADNSIGNVTGSNSVNVFLGLGLPWLIAAVYWNVEKKKSFPVPEGALGFSVVLYLLCATLCIILLLCRRKLSVFGCAELGGTVPLKYLSTLICLTLWLLYVIVASLHAHDVFRIDFY